MYEPSCVVLCCAAEMEAKDLVGSTVRFSYVILCVRMPAGDDLSA